MVHMPTTLDLDEDLLEEARRLTGIGGKTALLHRGLREIIRRESARLLARTGGSAPKMKAVPRRRLAARSSR
jgi:Arc/MetJ family transcription regulator